MIIYCILILLLLTIFNLNEIICFVIWNVIKTLIIALCVPILSIWIFSHLGVLIQNRRTMEDAQDSNASTEPSVFLDQTVLSPGSRLRLDTIPEGRPYSVNDSTFYCDNGNSSNASYVEFEVHARRRTNIPDNFLVQTDDSDQYVYCSTPESETDEDLSTGELRMIVHKVSYGVVINSNVFLTHNQWNTIMYVDGHLLKCLVCEMYTDVEASAIHTEDGSHRGLLDSCKPLARFDLSITRKIRDQYHCAVCNTAFDIDDEETHFASKSHEDNLLSAINKVSDIDLTSVVSENKNNDCYHFNANAINDRNYRNGTNDRSYRNAIIERSGRNGINNTYRNEINDRNGNNDSDSGSDGDCEYDHEIDEYASLWGDVEPKKSNSYATMLKKPKIIDLPKFVEKELGNFKVTVKFDCYHMLIKPKLNRFYCMVCKDYGHIRDKPKHCSDLEHLHKLEKFDVVQSFGDYFIRVMDDKLYHCGQCNNLVLKNDMEDHLIEKHGKKISSENAKTSPNKENTNNGADNAKAKSITDTIKNNDGIAKDVGNKSNDVKNVVKDIKNNVNDNKNHVNDSNNQRQITLLDRVFVDVFGFRMIIPLLSYNIMFKRPGYIDFYCGLCNVTCVEVRALEHMGSISHIQILQRTPFILPFSSHLIRAIRDILHCAICNIPVPLQLIYMHIHEPVHLKLLNQALSSNNPPNVNTNNTQNQITINPSLVNPNEKVDHTKIPTNEHGAIKKGTVAEDTNLATKRVTATVNEATAIVKEATSTIEEATAFVKEATSMTDLNNSFDEMNLMLNDSMESDDFDFEDFVYVKYYSAYFKISITAYNTLVQVGDGTRYCFVCSTKVFDEQIKKHVDSRSHVNNMKQIKFLDRYTDVLFRQLYLMYHCSVCNVIISRREIKNHLSWQTHTKETTAVLSISKKTRKNDFKSGKIIHAAEIGKEVIYLNEKDSQNKIIFKIRSDSYSTFEKKKKIVIVGGDVLKIDFENYHSISEFKGGLKCHLCQVEMCEEDLATHVNGEYHLKNLENGFRKDYLVQLLRQINENALHCMICNNEVSNKPYIIKQHIDGKRHVSALESIRMSSSQANAYTDCEDNPLQL